MEWGWKINEIYLLSAIPLATTQAGLTGIRKTSHLIRNHLQMLSTPVLAVFLGLVLVGFHSCLDFLNVLFS